MTIMTTANLILSTPSLDDVMAINDFEIRNKDHLKKWESMSYENYESHREDEKKHLKSWVAECEDQR